VQTNFGAANLDQAPSAMLQLDGRIVAAGTTNHSLWLLQADGKIVAVGFNATATSKATDFALTRYLGN
jgi:hypothetical protein